MKTVPIKLYSYEELELSYPEAIPVADRMILDIADQEEWFVDSNFERILFDFGFSRMELLYKPYRKLFSGSKLAWNGFINFDKFCKWVRNFAVNKDGTFISKIAAQFELVNREDFEHAMQWWNPWFSDHYLHLEYRQERLRNGKLTSPNLFAELRHRDGREWRTTEEEIREREESYLVSQLEILKGVVEGVCEGIQEVLLEEIDRGEGVETVKDYAKRHPGFWFSGQGLLYLGEEFYFPRNWRENQKKS